MKSVLFALIITAFICVHVSAQSVLRKGSIVLEGGEKKTGWINYKSWNRNPVKITFRSDSLSKETSIYGIKEIFSFEVNGLDSYRKAIVLKDIAPVDLGKLWPAGQDSVVRDTVLLRVIVKGPKIGLYSLVDEKNHFYVEESGSYKELSYRVALDRYSGSRVVKEEGYKTELIRLANQYDVLNGSLERVINAASYTDDSLEKIILAMNRREIAFAPRNSKRNFFHFFAGAGFSSARLDVSGENATLNGVSFKNRTTFFPIIGVDFSGPRNLQDLMIRIELTYKKIRYSGIPIERPYSNGGYSYDLKGSSISPYFSILYSFLRKEHFRIYAGGGLGINISSYQQNELQYHYGFAAPPVLVSDYVALNKAWLSGHVKIGALLYEHWDMSLTKGFFGKLNNNAGYGLDMNALSCALSYRF
ncbi:hypothetical protein [Pedobacter sp.]|jgi:hypothetical protein|uniref:hypothetical protein n=1 Tax=Pedobacter sp. TaxID=1411316 RepID=UPI002B7755A9|nr:hypothetical protein [Pedobacter sp.]HWW41536.1 hypothetical protein [Pedobacter sp.]